DVRALGRRRRRARVGEAILTRAPARPVRAGRADGPRPGRRPDRGHPPAGGRAEHPGRLPRTGLIASARRGYAAGDLPYEPSCRVDSTTRAAMADSAILPQARGLYCFLLPTSPSTLSTPS